VGHGSEQYFANLGRARLHLSLKGTLGVVMISLKRNRRTKEQVFGACAYLGLHSFHYDRRFRGHRSSRSGYVIDLMRSMPTSDDNCTTLIGWCHERVQIPEADVTEIRDVNVKWAEYRSLPRVKIDRGRKSRQQPPWEMARLGRPNKVSRYLAGQELGETIQSNTDSQYTTSVTPKSYALSRLCILAGLQSLTNSLRHDRPVY